MTTNPVGAGNGKGYMGGDGVMRDAPEEPRGGGKPSDIEGPLGDHGSIQGELYGDLYKLLRYLGGEDKNVPAVDENGEPVMNPEPQPWSCPDGHVHLAEQQAWDSATAIGGEPVLTEDFVAYTVEEVEGDVSTLLPGPYDPDDPNADCTWWPAPYASQCIQPIASWERWGNLRNVVPEENVSHAALDLVQYNVIPVVKTYDPTWERTEFTVGTVEDPTYFIPPGGQGTDDRNGEITYVDGVTWTDLIQEVSFGRLNQARATEAVLMAAFDEAIRSINAALAIRLDPAGRLLLTQIVFDEVLVYPAAQTVVLNVINVEGTGFDEVEIQVRSGDPVITGKADKAIDSPLENLALYLKMMRDGHLVTPGDERDAIDRSVEGGIPIDLLLGLDDGPSTDLRPTIDIKKMKDWGLAHLVDVEDVDYYTYYEIVEENGEIVDYVLHAVTELPPDLPSDTEVEEWNGIPTAVESSPEDEDFELCAATLSAAADKGGKLTVDHVVYLNSILGINKVVGTSEDGTIDYSKNPEYFDYGTAPDYDREAVFGARGWMAVEPVSPGGDPVPAFQAGMVLILLPINEGGDPVPGTWTGEWGECSVPILPDPDLGLLGFVPFRELGEDEETRAPNDMTATVDIGGFAQGADDNLSLIDFVHTYQIPGNR